MNDNQDISSLTPDEKLQAENEILKLKLQAEFGMEKMESSLNEGMENEWLNYIYNFEKQFAEQKSCTVYDFIGRPGFRKANELTKEETPKELERIMEIMQSNGIDLGTICEYEDAVIYRFITEELFEKETNEIRIPGMMHCFTYEAFHPNHDYDIREHSNQFIQFLISKKWDEFMNNILLASTVSYNQQQYDPKTFPAIIKAFQSEYQKMKLLKWEIQSVSFDMETRTGILEGSIKYRSFRPTQIYEGAVNLEFKLEYDFWSVSKVVVPGFSK